MISNSLIYINGILSGSPENAKNLLDDYEKACKESNGPVEIRINSCGGFSDNIEESLKLEMMKMQGKYFKS